MSMQAYLAAKYMSGAKADAILAHYGDGPAKKKKKRKATASAPAAGPSLVKDEDEPGWGATGADDESEDEAKDAVIASDRGFKKRRTDGGEGSSGWATVRAATPPPAADEAPLVAGVTADPGFVAGLLTKEQMRAMRKAKAAAPAPADDPQAQETVYRDAAGRKIDTKAERAEAARRKREREEKEAAKMEWGKGLVQREEKDKRKEEAARMRDMKGFRGKDDQRLNEEMKETERWNDPAAAFLSKKRAKGPRKPEYTGPPPPPNRFGIKPGYRWDGVDRGTGFENRLFQRMNERKRTGREAYEWAVDDM